MAETVNISTVLKRNLKGGKEFDILMPRVRCKTTHLGEGDTFFTVDRMKDWIEKYRHQTAKIALRLEGRTVEETVNNIYNFLYNHIQYTADGSLQQLRSPACTWMQRKKGVDCKSYSVFASSVLSNLGIKHAVRQVRQTYFYPEEFTHVYVVVFKDQSKEHYESNAPTFVLDATKHENTEVNYLEKVDLYMNKLSHVGLNAPQDARASKITGNFDKFCSFLLSKGAPVSQVNLIRAGVSQYTRNGVDPRMNIVYDGLEIEGVVYPIDLTEFVAFRDVKRAFYGENYPTGLNGVGLGFSFGQAFESLGDISKQTGGGSSQNSGTGGIVDAGLTLASGAVPFGGLIKGILDKLEISKNISNVLKYGLSSWGATTTPEGMKKRFAETCYPWLQEMLANTTMENVDRQLTAIDVKLRGNMILFQQSAKYQAKAKSTKLADEWGAKECQTLAEKVFNSFNEQFKASGVQVSRQTVDGKSSALNPYPVTGFFSGKDLKTSKYFDDTQYYIYTVDKASLKSWNNQQLQQQNQNNNTPTSGNTYQPVSTGNQQNNSGNTQEPQAVNEPKKSNNNVLLIGGGVAMAGLLLFPMMKGSPTANTPAAKKPAKKKK